MTAIKPKLVGVNHVAFEVGDVDAALDFLAGSSIANVEAMTTSCRWHSSI